MSSRTLQMNIGGWFSFTRRVDRTILKFSAAGIEVHGDELDGKSIATWDEIDAARAKVLAR